jgi:poly-gamma-glutamate synthesis protein (capsule biosynthesis protein)
MSRAFRPLAALLLVAALQCAAQNSAAAIDVCLAGDLLLDRGVRARIRNIGPDALLNGVRAPFAACDAVIANLECPATLAGSPLEKKYVFRAEPSWLPALGRAGITHVTLANNHSNDQGREGLRQTMRALRDAGIEAIGAGAAQREACGPALIEVRGARLAVFASVPLPLENWMFGDTLAGPCQDTPSQSAERVREWKQRHPGDVVLVLLHWGIEHREIPEPEQVADAHALIDAGADAVVGHHPHVVQRAELYRGKPILYSIGNFVFDQRTPLASRCLVARLRIPARGRPALSLLPLAIARCAPVPLPSAARARFLADLRRLSPGVRLREARGWWTMEAAGAERGEHR